MIPFFRKIRKTLADDNKPIKYLRYAIGEIVLVVIGILIALQINNWNESRKLNMIEKDVIENLIEDLQSDYINFEEDKKELEKQLKLVDQLIVGPANSRIDKNTYLHQLRWGGAIIPIAFEDNISKSIINKDIIETIKIYYRNQKKTMSSRENYSSVVMDIVRPFLRNQGIHNSKSVKEISLGSNSDQDNIELLIEEKLSAQYGSEEFEQVLFELRLKAAELLYELDILSKANRKLVPILKRYINY